MHEPLPNNWNVQYKELANSDLKTWEKFVRSNMLGCAVMERVCGDVEITMRSPN